MTFRDALMIILGAALIVAWYLLYMTYRHVEDPYRDWSCPVIEQELTNFRECLAVGSACHVDGPDAFGEYHDWRHWFDKNCE